MNESRQDNTSHTYKNAGVDTEAGQDFVKQIRKSVESTFSRHVLSGLGGFSGAFDVSFLKEYKNPVLLSGTDGVGTKLEVARLLDYHETVGIDLVAMCANDILTNGGKPLFFLDYIACGRLDISKMEKIVAGIAEGCRQAGTSLIGGETAEHPGIMKEDEYDLAGFCVGVAEKEKIIDGSGIRIGDEIIGLHSSGPHSNGFSLLRRLFLPGGRLPDSKQKKDLIRNEMMAPTRIYVKPVLKLLESIKINGMAHITGGGFYENIPRILPPGTCARIARESIPSLPLFDRIKKDFQIDEKELFSVFNMGIGYILVIPRDQTDIACSILIDQGCQFSSLGKIIGGAGSKVEIF